MRTVRLLLWGLLGIVAAGLAAFFALGPGPQDRIVTRPADDVQSAIGGPFTLTDANGDRFSNVSLTGRPYALFFGFTHCPDVCPTTLARLVRLREEVGAGSFDIVFVTVDPERDGPTEVGKYAELFDTPIIGLTGTPAEIEKVKAQFGVYAAKSGEGEAYNVDHTASVFLMGRDGQFVSTIAPEEGREPALAKLRRIVG